MRGMNVKYSRSITACSAFVFTLGVAAMASAGETTPSPAASQKSAGCKNMQGMDMKGMDMKGMDMKGMDMKDMDRQKCMDMMKDTSKEANASKPASTTLHQADGTVQAVDAAKGQVTLAHGPVKSLGWPAMTMGFAVKDKALLDKLAVGQKVHVAFKKEGNAYVVTEVR